jgi:hypothetical protein
MFVLSLRRLVASLLAIVALSPVVCGGIEAVKGKQYKLSPKNGPWMIMVAAIRDVEEEGRRTEGMSARQVADELVYELRVAGIPAYMYELAKEVGTVASPSPTEAGSRKYIAQHGYISVLAGNFKSSTDPKALQVMKFIKGNGRGGFKPAFLEDEKSGAILPRTPGRPNPFSRAFLTMNPLVDDEAAEPVDELIVELNAGQEYSLLQNPARYSLVIATFTGGSVIQVAQQKSSGGLNFFEKNFGTSLDAAAENAIVLTDYLRHARKHGYETDYEAWVLHERYRSVVTIGSFSSKDDPRIRTLMTQFGVKTVRHPDTGVDVQVAEIFSVPRMPKQGDPPAQTWLFDSQPKLIAVPKVR